MDNASSDTKLAQAGEIYRSHLNAAMIGKPGERPRGFKAFKAVLRAVDDLPAKRFDPQWETGDRRVWVWSDLHLSHENIIRYANRPFTNAVAMDEKMYANWRTTVGADDTLLFVGDVAMGRAVYEGVWSRIPYEAGRAKHLVVGNHDLTRKGILRAEGFDGIWSLMVVAGNPSLLLTHMPLFDVPDGWVNVHGHTHNSPVTRSPHINVSVEHLCYRPLELSRIRSLAKALVDGDYPSGDTTLARIESLEGR